MRIPGVDANVPIKAQDRSAIGGASRRSESLARAAAVVRRIVAERHDRPSLVADLACEIGAEIIEGVRKPGDDLNSAALATLYQTSRTPIREALMLLEKEGLVDVPPRRRPRVAILGTSEIQDIYKARVALVGLIATDVATSASDAQMKELRALVERMSQDCDANDATAYLWTSVEFHEVNTLTANNRIVKRILDSLLLRTLPLRRLSLAQPGAMIRSCRDHVNLMRAYEDRDPTLAAAIIRSNLLNALSRIQSALPAARSADRTNGEKGLRSTP